MSKRKTLRRLSSAALLSLAMYSQTMSPGWTKEVRAFETRGTTRIERRVDVKRKVGEVIIGRGTVKSVNGSALVVSDKKDNQVFNVVLDEKTKILSKSLIKVTVSDIKEGHEVSIIGKIENGDTSTLRAVTVRDLSLSVRSGQFKGEVVSVDSTGINIMFKDTRVRVLTEGALFTDRVGKTISPDQIKIGDTLKVKGTLNGGDNTISKVTSIKDQSLPVR